MFSKPHYDLTKRAVVVSTSIPLPENISTFSYIWSCHPKYLEAAGQIRDCLLYKFAAPAGWTQEFKIKTGDLREYLTCPVQGSAGVVEYFIKREPDNYKVILRDICDGNKHEIIQNYLLKNPAADSKVAEMHYLMQVANKDGTAAGVGNYGRAIYKYNCHEYELDCINGKMTEDIKESGYFWGCTDVLIAHQEL